MCLREQKLKLFIETYHAPFTLKHWYWTGLLLIARAILYLVVAANVSNDPQIALSAIVFTMICILFLIAFINIRMYQKVSLCVLDTFFVVNILLFSVFTWYSLSNTNINQKAVAYTSVIITFIILWLIILYHVYAYTKIFSKVKINKLKVHTMLRARRHLRQPTDGNIHRFKDYLLNLIVGSANTDEYDVVLVDEQPAVVQEPTYSVVELPSKPHQHPDQSDTVPKEAIVYNYIPGAGEDTASADQREVAS